MPSPSLGIPAARWRRSRNRRDPRTTARRYLLVSDGRHLPAHHSGFRTFDSGDRWRKVQHRATLPTVRMPSSVASSFDGDIQVVALAAGVTGFVVPPLPSGNDSSSTSTTT